MKRVFKTAIMVAAVLLASCSTTDKSWEMYCKKYSVDPEKPTEKQKNFYLDCYCGSVEEECDLSGLVCTPLDTKDVCMVARSLFIKDSYYVFFKEPVPTFNKEFLEVDVETAMLIRGAIDLGDVPMKGFLVFNEETGVFNFSCKLKK